MFVHVTQEAVLVALLFSCEGDPEEPLKVRPPFERNPPRYL